VKSTASDQIHLDQVLHGYRGGHRRLAGTVDLDDVSASQMAVMSDLLTSSLSDSKSSYLCGYPLQGAYRYVLARTWSAPEMARPGCVWTHSLVLDYGTLAKLPDPTLLLGLFHRPTPLSLPEYSKPIIMSAGDLYRPEPTPERNAWHADKQQFERARMVLAGLYIEGGAHDLLLRGQNTIADEELALALWRQMWPRLRRNFLFATCASARLEGVRTGFSMLISQDAPREDTEKLLDAVRVLAVRPGFGLLLEDLPKREPAPFRRFLWRYSSDAEDPRAAGIGLGDVYERLARDGGPEALATAADLIHELFGDPKNCVLLKSDLMLGRLHFGSSADEASAFLAMLSTFKNSPSFMNESTLMDRLVSLNQDATGISKILQSATPAKENELGGVVIKSIAVALPSAKVAAAGCDTATKVSLARANSNLLSLAPFWSCAEDDRLIIMRELQTHDLNLDEAVSGLLPQIGEREATWLLQQEGSRAAAAILREIVLLKDPSGFPNHARVSGAYAVPGCSQRRPSPRRVHPQICFGPACPIHRRDKRRGQNRLVYLGFHS
jgi:hypothetical protein